MDVEFKGKYTQKDVFRAVSLANKPTLKRLLMRIGIGLLVLVAYIAYTVLTTNQSKTPILDPKLIGSHLLYLLMIGLFLIYPNITSWITAFKIWRAPKMHLEYSGSISDDGIQYTGKKTLITWETIAKKQTTSDLIVLLTSNGILCFFPRKFFISDAEWLHATVLIDAKVVLEKKKPIDSKFI